MYKRQEQEKKANEINLDNFYTNSKPMSLQESRITGSLPNFIEGHIIVCGIVKGIRSLILPLRKRTLGSLKRPIVILADDSVGAED